MERIPIDKLRYMWEEQGTQGEWRKILKNGYKPVDFYFEFGLMPEKEHECEYRIILDHEVPVWLCPGQTDFKREYAIEPDNARAGETEFIESKKVKDFRFHTLYVSEEDYTQFITDAQLIYKEYCDEYIICFWGIPNKWFHDLALVQFITDQIVLSKDYIHRRHSSHSWYWP